MIREVALVTGAAGIGGATSRRLSHDATAIGVPDISGEERGEGGYRYRRGGRQGHRIDLRCLQSRIGESGREQPAGGLRAGHHSRQECRYYRFRALSEISFEREEMKPQVPDNGRSRPDSAPR